jgi:hypothetical protein
MVAVISMLKTSSTAGPTFMHTAGGTAITPDVYGFAVDARLSFAVIDRCRSGGAAMPLSCLPGRGTELSLED